MGPPASTASMLPPLLCFNRRPSCTRTDVARLHQSSVEPGWRSHATLARESAGKPASTPNPAPQPSAIPRFTPGRQRESGSRSPADLVTAWPRSTADSRNPPSRGGGSRPGAPSLSSYNTLGGVSNSSRERSSDVLVGSASSRSWSSQAHEGLSSSSQVVSAC